MNAARLVATTLLLAPLHLAAQAQVQLSGRVLEFGTRSGISGASVSIPSIGRVTTNSAGDFRLPRMAPGERVVTISALGYETRELRLNIQRDTMIIVELEVQAIKVDSLKVQARAITVRGKITDQNTKESVFDADVTIAARSAASNLLGNFKVTRVPANVPAPLTIRAPGYEPFAMTITADRDTSLRIELKIDSVGLRMLAAQVGRLEKRSRGVNASLRQFNGDALAYAKGQALDEFLKHNMFQRAVYCFFVDDIERTGALPDILSSFLVEELDRIEVYDRGLMLRVYTRRYIAKQSNNKPLARIIYINLGAPKCM